MQVWKVRLPDGRVVRPTEWSSTPLYSTVEIGAAAPQPELQAYGYGLGGEVPGSFGGRKSTDADTNMRGDGGQLPENEELLLYSVMMELFVIPNSLVDFWPNAEFGTPDPPEVSALNVQRFQCDTLFTLVIAETKDYFDHPVGFFPASMGVHHITSAARPINVGAPGANIIVGASHGSPASFDNRRVATPKRIEGGQVYVGIFRFPQGSIRNLNFGGDANARLRVRVYSDGYRMRPVA